MSIENAILELAKAIITHAEAIKFSNKSPQFSTEPVKQKVRTKPESSQQIIQSQPDVSLDQYKEKKLESDIIDPTILNPDKDIESKIEIRQSEIVNLAIDATNNIITSEMCKNLAKEKMASGVNRTEIKNIITELGAESIADLSEKDLVEFHTKVQTLK